MLARLASSGNRGAALDGTLRAVEACGVLALLGVLAALLRRDLRSRIVVPRGGAPPAAPYRFVLCEGERCVPLGALGERSLPAAEVALESRAARYRADGAIGQVVLVDGRTKWVVARRRVWP